MKTSSKSRRALLLGMSAGFLVIALALIAKGDADATVWIVPLGTFISILPVLWAPPSTCDRNIKTS